ncbi:SDR family NAD(P)-dependent oxidoreductase [Nocardioides malaquae]|uniref:SDR family NAD(P)-dependent oxidoreductase n=1 Tax=Nocardioides malaquae TaxID=2773426 RepID=UPI001D0CE8D2|nr:SDR family NAD(P)-dependent oxidoreductase [Nocardioides malaquae]
MDLHLRDRVFLLTGASLGLGRTTARSLVEEGARVVVSGRGAAALDDLAHELGTDRAATVTGDNADPLTTRRMLEVAESRWGRVDGVLVSVERTKAPLTGLGISNGLRPRPGHGGQGDGRRVGSAWDPGAESPAGPDRHRPRAAARREHG